MDEDWIGLRIARFRTDAGLTQEQLGALVEVSGPYVSMIESGRRPVARRALLIAFAEALGVSTNDLTGAPQPGRNPAERPLHVAVPRIRAALNGAFDEATDAEGGPPADLLQADAGNLMAARMACDYRRLGNLATSSLARGHFLVESSDRLMESGGHYVQALFTLSMALRPLGYLDLSILLAERAEFIAARAGRPDAIAAAAFARSQCLLAGGVQGMRAASRSLATAAANRLERGVGGLVEPANACWFGLLHLQAGLAAASLGNDDDANAHMDVAEDMAAREPFDPWHMEFSAANCGVWRVAATLEGGNPERAPDIARRIDRTKLRTVQRRSHLMMHTAHGYFAQGQHEKATNLFLAAEEIAPTEVHSRPRVRETVGQMLRDARRQAGSEQLRDLARRVGVDPLART